ncbi:tetratricopeptide repeat protein [Gracilibacillus suaedae]|uniref:tetratricopeptide repeat protein n=1 Tax=Gracilibacillus suaedae TaxID=2820273 RepID=UPI001ABDF80F|nr:tetratricopeptide repeat protein [Gracilibacillus suaedae]
MNKIILPLFMFLLVILSGCSLLSGTDPEFSRQKYDDWYENEQYEAALADINERLEKYPEDPYLLNEKGHVLNLMERSEDALNTLNIAIEQGNDDTLDSAYNNKSVALNELGEYEQAIVAAQKAIDLSDQEPEQFINMGNAHSLLERDQRALEYYDKALEIDDSAPYALYGKGVSLYYLTEYEEAIPYLEKYIETYPDDTDGLWYLVYSYDLLEDYNATLPYLDKIIQVESEQSLAALDYKGLMLTYSGNFTEAEELYNSIIEQFPNDGIGYYGKSVALVQQGEIEQGLEELDQSIRIDEDYKDIAYSDPLFAPIYDDETFIQLTEY